MLSRRELLGLLVGRPKKAQAAVAAEAPVQAVSAQQPGPPRPCPVFPIHRPPGAIAEADFLSRCTRCGDCFTACPHEAVVTAPARLRAAAGTPVIDAASAPCQQCADTPCIEACAPNALSANAPLKMGTARIETMDCLAWQRSFCTVCSERCPVPDAITLDQGRPTIDASVCTGCGVCLYVCPAPRKAVMLLPNIQRPSWLEVNDGAE
jgi:ferredoxin-type protein NapG